MVAFKKPPPPKKQSLAFDSKSARVLMDAFGGRKHKDVGQFLASRLSAQDQTALFAITKNSIAEHRLAQDAVKPRSGVGNGLPKDPDELAKLIKSRFTPEAVEALCARLREALAPAEGAADPTAEQIEGIVEESDMAGRLAENLPPPDPKDMPAADHLPEVIKAAQRAAQRIGLADNFGAQPRPKRSRSLSQADAKAFDDRWGTGHIGHR